MKTREEWLLDLVARMRPMFLNAGYTVPEKLRISCSFPSRQALRGGKRTTMGQCWSPDASKDQTTEVLISPLMEDPLDVAATVAHELLHAALGTEVGHAGPFKRGMKAIGLVGPARSTEAGDKFRDWFRQQPGLGRYPHAELDARAKEKKQGTRMLKCYCRDCGYTVRTTAKWLELGTPLCVCGAGAMAHEPGPEEEGE